MSTSQLLADAAATSPPIEPLPWYANPQDMVLLVIFAMLMFFVLLNRRRNSIGLPLVLKKFTVNGTSANGIAVQIVGRKPGITGWLLTVLGFDALTTLTVSDAEVSFSSSSLYGQLQQLIPLSRISSTRCGYSRPFGCLLIGVLSIVFGIGLAFEQYAVGAAALLSLGGLFFTSYWIYKAMLISFTAGGMEPIGLRFRPSVIHGVSVDFPKVAEAVSLINGRVVAVQEAMKR